MGTEHFRKAVLKGKVAFDLLFQEGRWFTGPTAKIIFLKRSSDESSKIAVCIPRSVRKAVQRNRLKRILRSSVDSFVPRIKPGYWIAIFPRNDFEQLKQMDRTRSLRMLMQRASLLEERSRGD